MSIARNSLVILLASLVILASGCVSEEQYNDMKAQNRIQQERIASLESELNSANIMLSQLQKKLKTCLEQNELYAGAKDAEVAALEQAIAEQKAIIDKLRAQLLKGPSILPPELNEQLIEFAASSDLVTYDENTGVLKFKSDLTFGPGSAVVESKGAAAIGTLAGILSSGQGSQFDIVIAGHTDDQPIKYSKAKHATNWHLSAHRAIGVLQVMLTKGVNSQRLSVRGFGDQRPVAPNAPGNKGNAANRRVEIFIVNKGA